MCLIPLTIARSSLEASLEGLYSAHVPLEHAGKARSLLGLLLSAVGVLAPSYGAMVFLSTASAVYHISDLIFLDRALLPDAEALKFRFKGVLVAVHYFVLLVVVPYFLVVGSSSGVRTKRNKAKTD